jgi:hypothetical protein
MITATDSDEESVAVSPLDSAGGYTAVGGAAVTQESRRVRCMAMRAAWLMAMTLLVALSLAGGRVMPALFGRPDALVQSKDTAIEHEGEMLFESISTCSGRGENCWSSQCCRDPATRCYEKNQGWAVCRTDCSSGVDPSEPAVLQTPWTCNVIVRSTLLMNSREPPPMPAPSIGELGNCSVKGENCVFNKCCVDPTAKCFEKYPGWAACKKACVPGAIDSTEPKVMQTSWSCKALEVGAEEEKKGEPDRSHPSVPLPVCATTGEDCQESRCCDDPDAKCYEKHHRWAVCRLHCTPGVNRSEPEFAQTPWSCQVLTRNSGELKSKAKREAPATSTKPAKQRSTATTLAKALDRNGTKLSAAERHEIELRRSRGVCSGAGEDCQVFKCCQDADMTCYKRDAGWAVCKGACTPGTDGMSQCEVLRPEGAAERKRGHGAGPDFDEEAEKQPAPCAKGFDDCRRSACCADPSLKCYEKDAGYARCRRSCKPGVDSAEPAYLQTPWTCTEVTPGMKPGKALLVPQVRALDGPTLFCFSLVLPRSYEVALLRAQLLRGLGISLCNSYVVYSNETVELFPGPPVRITSEVVEGSLKCDIGGKFKTALNSDIFVRIWKHVILDGRFRKYDWTVKVDPDAVFLPDRLRAQAHNINAADVVYMNNCKDGLHGPLEVLSHGAMGVYTKGIDRCVSKLEFEFSDYGEDVFLRHCLGLLKVSRIDDFGLLTEKFNGEIPQCTTGAVSFHPLKSWNAYMACLAQTALPP